MRRLGRTFRKRLQVKNRREEFRENGTVDPKILDLKKWLKGNGFSAKSTHLRVHTFSDSGRGLMALKTFKPGQCLVSIPENLLITTTTVLGSYLGPVIKSFSGSCLSPMEAICSFLIIERYRGRNSSWYPYIDILPQSYSLPFYWTDEERHSLPKCVFAKAQEQRILLQSSFQKLCHFHTFAETVLPDIHGAFNYENFCWAWSSVNSRCVYFERPGHPELNGEPDHYALAPFLDFFNHSPNAKVRAFFNDKERSYKIQTLLPIRKYSEAFINYGPHDNTKLILEYGFAVPCNPNDSYDFTVGNLLSTCCDLRLDANLNKKEAFLKKFNLVSGLSCTADGLSWNLLAAVRILMSPTADSQHMMNIYLDDESSSNRNQRCVAFIRTLLRASLSTIPDSKNENEEMTYHQKLASDLGCTFRSFLNCGLRELDCF